MFTLTQDGSAVIEQSSGTYIPLPAGGEAGQRYLAWLAEGNTPEPADQPPPKTYAELRAAEYPPLLDLIDGLVKDDAAQVQAYKDACLAVKAKYPKP